MALLMADQHDPAPPQRREAAHDRLVLAIMAIAAQRNELVEGMADEIAEMRSLRMTRNLRLLPRCERGIKAGEQIGALALEPLELACDIDIVTRGDRKSPRLNSTH